MDPATSAPPSAPKLSPAAAREKAARLQREADALRENLLRRKRQARARAADSDPPKEPPCR